MLKLKTAKAKIGDFEFHFNVSFAANQIHAIVGKSGEGKSTLLNFIAGFEPLNNGTISWDEQVISGQDPHQRPITSLFQEHNLFAHLTVFKNIALGLNPGLKLTKAQLNLVEMSIDNVGLRGKANRLPKQLSGGEAQRVALARALARARDELNPRPILLLDEPFSALDPETRLDMRNLIADIAKKYRLTVLIVSHNPTEMLAFADSVSLVVNGQILQQHNILDGKLPPKLDEFINI
ncbi:MAG: ATP-binding cassette domain-containing protein [Rhizobiales bacterium]|nr:ATP-binding cassette domain-containing protein [Hyphomicrobiales bacterium]NRB14586.1 ATP-binding cassette domain-containing protein [Hyphomicrobiales bacterium]